MKIGIITFWETQDNYGQVLQAYALQRLLEDAGHEPFLIRYSLFSDILAKPGRWKSIFSYHKVMQFIKRKTHRNIMNTTLVDRKFDYFKRKYIKSTATIYRTLMELRANPPEADCYVCGSDQVWYSLDDYEVYRNITRAYFLDFGTESIPRYAFAASFGRTDFPQGYIDAIRPLLDKFQGITIREAGGVEVCRKAGRADAVRVFDPTCLCALSHYTDIAVCPSVQCKYIFIYLIGDVSFDRFALEQFADSKGCDVIYVGSQGRQHVEQSIYPTVEEWIGWIQNAEYVVTNSFHGSVFAVLFRRELAVLTRYGLTRSGGDDRFISMLERIGLTNRIVMSSVVDVLSIPIDYSNTTILFTKEIEKDLLYIHYMMNL